MHPILYVTSGAAIICIISLAVMLISAFRKYRADLAEPRGSKISGIIYAFTVGMLPGAKESISHHIITYLAGIILHIGIFSAFLYSAVQPLVTNLLFDRIADYYETGITIFYVNYFTPAMLVLIPVGLACGLGLLVKRVAVPRLRYISSFDDYFSNILVNLFLASSVYSVLQPGSYIMYYIETALLLYIPLGKLKHCAFFPATRIMFGIFYGHRGILPKSGL
ncbi:MAG: hypothetical protein WC980_08870 [Candidatus Brocadiia bacterium]